MTPTEAIANYPKTQTIDISLHTKAMLRFLRDWSVFVGKNKAKPKSSTDFNFLDITIIVAVVGVAAALILAIWFGQTRNALIIGLLPWTAVAYASFRESRSFQLGDTEEIWTSLIPFLKTIAQDIHPDKRIHFQFSGKSYLTCPAAKRTLNPGKNTKILEESYRLPLATLRIPLRNGQDATLRIENRYRVRNRERKNTRGKTKVKTKWRKVIAITAVWNSPTPADWKPVRGVTVTKSAARTSTRLRLDSLEGAPEGVAPSKLIVRLFLALARSRPS